MKRTSLPIPYAGGTFPPKHLHHIIGGLLTFESDWSPALGEALNDLLAEGADSDRLDLGCIAAQGIFMRTDGGAYTMLPEHKPATGFLLELIARLQNIATVPMIDVRAYARWIEK